MSQTFDVIVIGAGIMGCSAAFQLGQRGLKVAVLEKASIGEGPTGKSSAIIRQHYSNELTARMALHSLRTFQRFAEQVGGECGFTRTGFVALVAAAYEPESGYADPYLTVNAYANAARRLGAKIFLDTEAIGIRLAGGQVIGVDTPHDKFDAPLVLISAGPWSARIAKTVGIEAPINACRVQVAFFRRPSGHEASHPVVADFVHAIYFRSETGNLTLVGLVDPAEANANVNPDRYNEYLDSDFVLDVGERLVRRYPAMELGQSAKGYAALYDITPDWHPIVDELPAGSGCFICAGFSGHGFKLGPAVGVMIADLLTRSSTSEFDPHLFRFSRYAENDPVRGQYEYSIAG